MATLITQSDLLDALAEANAAPEEARTVAEFATLFNWHKQKVRDAIGKLAMQNRIAVHEVRRPGIDKRNAKVTAYTILPPPKRK